MPACLLILILKKYRSLYIPELLVVKVYIHKLLFS
jgi:hypothetical protein